MKAKRISLIEDQITAETIHTYPVTFLSRILLDAIKEENYELCALIKKDAQRRKQITLKMLKDIECNNEYIRFFNFDNL